HAAVVTGVKIRRRDHRGRLGRAQSSRLQRGIAGNQVELGESQRAFREARVLALALDAEEHEQLVFLERSTNAPAEDLASVRRGVRAVLLGEEVIRVQ